MGEAIAQFHRQHLIALLHRLENMLNLMGNGANVLEAQHIAVALEGVGIAHDCIDDRCIIGVFFEV